MYTGELVCVCVCDHYFMQLLRGSLNEVSLITTGRLGNPTAREFTSSVTEISSPIGLDL